MTLALALFDDDLPGGGYRLECGSCGHTADYPKGADWECPECRAELVYPEGANW